MREISFNTLPYEFSHGHQPRGRGAWAFETGMADHMREHMESLAKKHLVRLEKVTEGGGYNGDINTRLWVNGTYLEAKRAVRELTKEAWGDTDYLANWLVCS